LQEPVLGHGADETGNTGTHSTNVRNVFVIGSDKKMKLIRVYPMTTGRNFDEVLRMLESLHLFG
jgi:alkyl hydroperoxide reductase subunit AhpC